MSAIVTSNNKVRSLDRQAEPAENITKSDAQDPDRVARLFMRLLRDVALLKRRFWPRRLDHEDREVDGTGITQYRFPHSFGGRVRWWVVDWQGAQPFDLARISTTDNNTLVLVSRVSGIVTIRVEEAG